MYGSLILKNRAEGVDYIVKRVLTGVLSLLQGSPKCFYAVSKDFTPFCDFLVQLIHCWILILITSVSTMPSPYCTSITTDLKELVRTRASQSITNIGFPKSKTPVLSKLISKMALNLSRLVPPSLVMPTSFNPKLNWLIRLLKVTERLSPSGDVVMGISMWEESLTCYLV